MADEDIDRIKARAKARAQAKFLAESAPEQKSRRTPMQMLGDIGMAGLRGAPAGPAGVFGGMGGEALKQQDEAVRRVAYGAGGGVTDLASKVMPPEAAGAVGYAANVGLQAIPALLGGGVAKASSKGLPMTLQDVARGEMRTALKPIIAHQKTGQADRAIETLLKNNIPLSDKGRLSMMNQVDDINRKVESIISNSGAKIDPRVVKKALEEYKKDFALYLDRSANEATVTEVWRKFRDHPAIQKATEGMPIQEAQKMKQALNKEFRNAWDKWSDIEYGARSKVRQTLREEIEKAEPEVAALNARERELLNANEVMDRALMREGNKGLIGLGGIAAHPVGAAATMFDRSSRAHSWLGRLLYKMAPGIPNAAMLGGGSLMSLKELGRQNEGD